MTAAQVSELRARFPDKDIQVDGGVGPSTIQPCAEAGTFGSGLWRKGSFQWPHRLERHRLWHGGLWCSGSFKSDGRHASCGTSLSGFVAAEEIDLCL